MITNLIQDIFLFGILGPTVGIYLNLMFPFAFWPKIIFTTIIFLCPIAIFIGIKQRAKIFGKILIIIALALWFFVGAMGLGTGT